MTLPPEDDEPGKCAILLKTMYGTQDASHAWQADYTDLLAKHGFQQGKAWASTVTHGGKEIKLLVHGDDFLALADQEAQDCMTEVLGARYAFRCDRMIGKGSGNHRTILNRIACYKEDTGCVTFEADPRHAEMIIRQLGLEGAKSVSTPAEKERSGDVLASVGLPPVTAEQTTLFRSLAMRAQFLAQDRADLNECVKS